MHLWIQPFRCWQLADTFYWKQKFAMIATNLIFEGARKSYVKKGHTSQLLQKRRDRCWQSIRFKRCRFLVNVCIWIIKQEMEEKSVASAMDKASRHKPLYCMPRELEENGHINVQDPVNCLMHWMWCRFLDIWQVWLFSKTSISVLTVVNKENTHVRSEGNNWNIEDKVERISARLAWQAATVTWNRKITKNWSLRSFKPPE